MLRHDQIAGTSLELTRTKLLRETSDDGQNRVRLDNPQPSAKHTKKYDVHACSSETKRSWVERDKHSYLRYSPIPQ